MNPESPTPPLVQGETQVPYLDPHPDLDTPEAHGTAEPLFVYDGVLCVFPNSALLQDITSINH